MNTTIKILTISGMLATVAWFFWNPVGWAFQWEPIVVFLFALAGFLGTEAISAKHTTGPQKAEAYPNDIVLFREFTQLLPSHGPIEFLRRHDFLLEFDMKDVRAFLDFLRLWDNAEHEFQNPELEKLREEFLHATESLVESINKYTVPNRSGLQAVRVDELKHVEEHETRFREESAVINDAAEVVVRLHQDLIRAGRQVLNLAESQPDSTTG